MDTKNDGAGSEMPAQDRALKALADLLEDLGGEAAYAFVAGGSAGDALLTSCQGRAAAVARAIVGLPAVTLHGASAKAQGGAGVGHGGAAADGAGRRPRLRHGARRRPPPRW